MKEHVVYLRKQIAVTVEAEDSMDAREKVANDEDLQQSWDKAEAEIVSVEPV